LGPKKKIQSGDSKGENTLIVSAQLYNHYCHGNWKLCVVSQL